MAELPVAVIGRRIGYVGGMPYLFAGTLRDNLLLGLRHLPLRPPEYDEEAMMSVLHQDKKRKQGEIRMALPTGEGSAALTAVERSHILPALRGSE